MLERVAVVIEGVVRRRLGRYWKFAPDSGAPMISIPILKAFRPTQFHVRLSTMPKVDVQRCCC